MYNYNDAMFYKLDRNYMGRRHSEGGPSPDLPCFVLLILTLNLHNESHLKFLTPFYFRLLLSMFLKTCYCFYLLPRRVPSISFY